MKRNFRFYFALFFAKCTALVLKLIGRKGTSMPGSWAIILCPDFLGRMPLPKTIIGVTGTNGKTTVCNMVEDVLEDNGYDFMCNRAGTNVNTGIASVLIANSTFFGRPKKDLCMLELDERSSPKILPYLKPDMLMCTNIFRDSYRRNAHMDFILGILNEYIPSTTRLVLNADDLLCSGLRQEVGDGAPNARATFGIDPQPGETAESHNIVQDIRVCPKCGEKLSWDLIRYHHIGRAHCPRCGFASPEPDYRVVSLDAKNSRMTVEIKGKAHEFPLPNTNMINVYNSLAAISFLCEFGLEPEKIAASMAKLSITGTRYNEEEINGRKLVLHLAKGQNPIACSRACENARDIPGKKAVFLVLDDRFDAAHSVESTAWLYDTDFEFLNDPDITQVINAGARHWDVYLRLLLAGLPEEKLTHRIDQENVATGLRLEGVEAVVVLYDIHNIGLASRIKAQVEEMLRAAPPLHGGEKEGESHEN